MTLANVTTFQGGVFSLPFPNGEMAVEFRWEPEPQELVISHRGSGLYGEGDTLAEAVADLRVVISEVFEMLTEREDHLSVELATELAWLRVLGVEAIKP